MDLALALEAEGDLRAIDLDVFVAQCREAVASVLLRVLLIAHANVGLLHEADDCCKHFFARKIGQPKVLPDVLADAAECLSKLDHALILCLVADFAPSGVIAALLAAARVATCCLKGTVRNRADPDASPGRRNDEGADAAQRVFVVDGCATRRRIAKALATAHAADARLRIRDVAQPSRLRRLLRVRWLSERINSPFCHLGPCCRHLLTREPCMRNLDENCAESAARDPGVRCDSPAMLFAL